MWERLKFLADTRDGRVLLKFAGLGAIGEGKLEMARALHAAALTPEPLGLVHGFLAERWCEDARPLATGDRPAAEIGRYVGARARLFPAEAWSGASLKRLLEMSRRNLSLGLGGSAAPLLTHWESRIASLSPRVHRVRTDNRLDCHEWLRVDGRLIKTDALDHCAAHDLIGCQDLAWDVAGAIAEFELDDGSTSDLIVAAEHASGRQVDLELLEFYQLAYLAFRLGQTHLAAGMCADEKQRLEPVEQGYRAKLQHLLWIASQARLGLSPRSIDERNEPAREQTFVPIG